MSKYTETALQDLCNRLHIDADFLQDCLNESIVEIRETNGRLDLDNGTTLHLRKIERLCHTFQVDVPTALLLRALRHRVAELEEMLASRDGRQK